MIGVVVCSGTGSDLEAITTCELCKKKLQLNIENFDINELYRTHGRVGPLHTPTHTPKTTCFKPNSLCIYQQVSVSLLTIILSELLLSAVPSSPLQSEYEFISCGLYLVVLLHLCEQRFSDVLGAANDAGVGEHLHCLHHTTVCLFV